MQPTKQDEPKNNTLFNTISDTIYKVKQTVKQHSVIVKQ